MTLEKGQYGASRIVLERHRQIFEELYTLDYDAENHKENELVRAALCYAYAGWTLAAGGTAREVRANPKIAVLWPWPQAHWKPAEDAERNLEKAGALIAAEIDRLERVRRQAAGEDEPGRTM